MIDGNVWFVDGECHVARQSDVAAFVGVSRRTVCDWLAKGCPGTPGDYCVPEIIRWARRHVWDCRWTLEC